MTDRIEHADHVDNADSVGTTETVANVQNLTVLPKITHDQKLIKTLTVVAVILIVGALTIALSLCVYFIRSKSTSDSAKSKQITALTKQIADGQAATQTALSAQHEQDLCSTAYSRTITSTNQSAFSRLTDVLVVLGTPDIPGATPTRQEKYATALVALTDADRAYQAAVHARDAYVAAGQPLPCPVDPNQPTG